jgi:hypothetical protein
MRTTCERWNGQTRSSATTCASSVHAGLLDRTTVFHPFEVPRVNVFDMMRQDEHLQFVLDAETGRQLGDGRPSFNEWRDSMNCEAWKWACE